MTKPVLSHEDVASRLRAEEAELKGFVRMLVGDRQAAEDLYQETCLVVWRRRADYRNDESFGRWARGIARRVVWRHWRRDGRSREAPLCEETVRLLEETWVHHVPRTDARLHALEACLAALREEERSLLGRIYGDGTPLRVLAGEVGRSADALKMLAFRLRRRLHGCVERRMAGESSDG